MKKETAVATLSHPVPERMSWIEGATARHFSSSRIKANDTIVAGEVYTIEYWSSQKAFPHFLLRSS